MTGKTERISGKKGPQMKTFKSAGYFVYRVLLHAVLRFNPLYKPVIPALLTIYLLALIFTVLYIHDRIMCTFIGEYKDLAISAWGFLLLMNFLEALAGVLMDNDQEGRKDK
jgi:hypothetical protein